MSSAPPAKSLSNSDLRALNSSQHAAQGSSANLPGIVPLVPQSITAILGPVAVKAGLVYYGAAERETSSGVVKSRKRILIAGTRTNIIFNDIETGEVLRMFRYGEIISPLVVACAQAEPAVQGITSILVKVGNAHDALLHFDQVGSTKAKLAKYNDLVWSTPERFLQVITAFHDYYVKSPLDIQAQPPETKLRRAASLKSPLKGADRRIELEQRMDSFAFTLPPKVQGSEALPGVGIEQPTPTLEDLMVLPEEKRSVSPFIEEERNTQNNTENSHEHVTLPPALVERSIAPLVEPLAPPRAPIPTDAPQSIEPQPQIEEHQQQQPQQQPQSPQQQEIYPPKELLRVEPKLVASERSSEDSSLIKQLYLDIANLKSERDSYQQENSRLTYELEEMQYDLVAPGEFNVVDEVVAASTLQHQATSPGPFGNFETTLVTADHTADDFNRLASQVLQLQNQLMEERVDRQNLVREEVTKTEQSYDAVVLNQQDEIRGLRDQLYDMELVFQRLRSGIDGGNTQAMLHSFHAGTTATPSLGSHDGKNVLSHSSSPTVKSSVRIDRLGDGTLSSVPLGSSTRPAVGRIEDVGTVPTPRYNYDYRAHPSSARSGQVSSSGTPGGTDRKSLTLRPDLTPGSRAVRNRLKLDI